MNLDYPTRTPGGIILRAANQITTYENKQI